MNRCSHLPASLPTFAVRGFLGLGHSAVVRGNLKVVLFCIALWLRFKNSFKNICVNSFYFFFWELPTQIHNQFSLGHLFIDFHKLYYLCLLHTQSQSNVWATEIFFHCTYFPSTWLGISSFTVLSILILVDSICSIVALNTRATVDGPQKSFPKPISYSVVHVFY